MPTPPSGPRAMPQPGSNSSANPGPGSRPRASSRPGPRPVQDEGDELGTAQESVTDLRSRFEAMSRIPHSAPMSMSSSSSSLLASSTRDPPPLSPSHSADSLLFKQPSRQQLRTSNPPPIPARPPPSSLEPPHSAAPQVPPKVPKLPARGTASSPTLMRPKPIPNSKSRDSLRGGASTSAVPTSPFISPPSPPAQPMSSSALPPPPPRLRPGAASPGTHASATFSKSLPKPATSTLGGLSDRFKSKVNSGKAAALSLSAPHHHQMRSRAGGKGISSTSYVSTGNESSSSDEEETTEDDSPRASPSSFSPSSQLNASSSSFRPTSEDLPDASLANRRPPAFTPPLLAQWKPHSSYHAAVAVCGSTVVIGHGDKLRIYRLGSQMEELMCTLGTNHEIKVSAMAFRPAGSHATGSATAGDTSGGDRNVGEEGRFLWCGTKEGSLIEFDMAELAVSQTRAAAHSAPICLLRRVGKDRMISVDEGGKICIWMGSPTVHLSRAPVTQRITMDRHSCPIMIGDQLWVGTLSEVGQNQSSNSSSSNSTAAAASSATSTARGPRVRIYQPFYDDRPFNAVSRPVSIPTELASYIGPVTCGTVIPSKPDTVYLGHSSGHVSCWSKTKYSCFAVQRMPAPITSLCGVGDQLWSGDRKGKISVYETDTKPWRALKVWNAHSDTSVASISIDPVSIREKGCLQVSSVGWDGRVHLWDGLLSLDWIQDGLEERQADFSAYRDLNLLLFTYNIDARTPDEFDQAGGGGMEARLKSAASSSARPDVISFGFQELIDLESKKLAAKSFLLGGGKKGKGVELGERISHQYRAWQDKLVGIVADVFGVGEYIVLLSDNLVGLFSLVLVRKAEVSNVRDGAVASLKTGMGGRMGNKGAVVSSLTVDDTSFAFVNCHLAAGQKHVRQRNSDLVDILDGVYFEKRTASTLSSARNMSDSYVGGGDGAMVHDHQVCFLSGDLNYRIDASREVCLAQITASKLDALRQRDQLLRERRANAAHRLRHYTEGEIDFIPTYKFKPGTDEWDPSEKQRIPAWCDRVLWHCRTEGAVKLLTYVRLNEMASDHRPVSAAFTVRVRRTDGSRRAVIKGVLEEQWEVEKRRKLAMAASYYQSFASS